VTPAGACAHRAGGFARPGPAQPRSPAGLAPRDPHVHGLEMRRALHQRAALVCSSHARSARPAPRPHRGETRHLGAQNLSAPISSHSAEKNRGEKIGGKWSEAHQEAQVGWSSPTRRWAPSPQRRSWAIVTYGTSPWGCDAERLMSEARGMAEARAVCAASPESAPSLGGLRGDFGGDQLGSAPAQ